MDPSAFSNIIVGLVLAIGVLTTRFNASGRKRGRELRLLRVVIEEASSFIHRQRMVIRALTALAEDAGAEIPPNLRLDANVNKMPEVLHNYLEGDDDE